MRQQPDYTIISLVLFTGIAVPAALWLHHQSKQQPKTHTPTRTPENRTATQAQLNLRAFLLTIMYAEGTYGVNAYRMMYGGTLTDSYAVHPNRKNTRWGLTSTAAGAYQILFGTWETIRVKLNLPDFSPASQDKAAIELIRLKGALEDVLAGRFYAATQKCKKVWASLPGAGYGQGERSYEQLAFAYTYVGGRITG